VLSPPHWLRYRLAYDHDRCIAVLAIFVRSLLGFYRKRAKSGGVCNGRTGSVTFIQRFGSAANLNVHLHVVVMDGVFTEQPSGELACSTACRAGRQGSIAFAGLAALDREMAGGDVAGFIVETVQGEGGMRVQPPGYLETAQVLCRHYGALFVLDEVQTGLGRTGELFGYVHHGAIETDVLLLAKALGGGLVALGAVLCTADAWSGDFRWGGAGGRRSCGATGRAERRERGGWSVAAGGTGSGWNRSDWSSRSVRGSEALPVCHGASDDSAGACSLRSECDPQGQRRLLRSRCDHERSRAWGYRDPSRTTSSAREPTPILRKIDAI
jgi:hypothetical protein